MNNIGIMMKNEVKTIDLEKYLAILEEAHNEVEALAMLKEELGVE